ncbi:hypothetical protein GGR51DRAFT_567223 [Nemania sp. FL0031]|nr:hypothetical protein GGR51DRAFT_567223 [Nemania sp. FL0031]
MPTVLVNGVLSNQKGSFIDTPPKSWNIRLRKVYSIFLAAHLYSVNYPFTPISWVTSLQAGRLLDQTFGATLIIGAAALHWHIARISYPLPVAWSFGVGNQPFILAEEGRHSDERNLFTWQPRFYWILATVESLLLAAAWIEPQSFISRTIVIAIVGLSWIVGLPAAPRAFRLESLRNLDLIWNSVISWEHLNNVLRR